MSTKVTIEDVASRASVCKKTVSLVLNKNGSVSEALTRRVLEAVDELGYRPNQVARSLRRQRTETVGVLIPTILNPFFPPVLKEIDNMLSSAGLSILFANTKEDEASEAALVSLMREKRVDGLLIAPYSAANLPLLEQLPGDGIPVVTFHLNFGTDRLDCVSWDDFRGSFQAVRHLIDIGRRRIAIIGNAYAALLPRLQGYEAALRAAGITPDPSLQFVSGSSERGKPLSDHTEMVLRILCQSSPPDAIFFTGMTTAIGALKATKIAGTRVPEDLALVAYDDYLWTEELRVPLTVVRRDQARLGSVAAELLLRRIRDGGPSPVESIVLPTELIVRASTVGELATGR